MNREFLKMQKLAGLITESQYKTSLNEAPTTINFNGKIKAGDEGKLKMAKGEVSSTDFPLIKTMFEKVKAESDGLTVAELAKAVNTDEEKVKELIQAVSSFRIFKTETSTPDKTPGRTAQRPTSNRPA